MNKKDLKFMMAYAECYGIKSFTECYAQVCKMIGDNQEYYDVSADEIIDDFLNAYQIIKITEFEGECFSMMRKYNYTIWQALRDWDLPTTVEEAKQQKYEELCSDEWNDTLNNLYWDRF